LRLRVVAGGAVVVAGGDGRTRRLHAEEGIGVIVAVAGLGAGEIGTIRKTVAEAASAGGSFVGAGSRAAVVDV